MSEIKKQKKKETSITTPVESAFPHTILKKKHSLRLEKSAIVGAGASFPSASS